MRDPQVFLNLLRAAPFLLISAVGMTFVILSGGIDLSVGGVVGAHDRRLGRAAAEQRDSTRGWSWPSCS